MENANEPAPCSKNAMRFNVGVQALAVLLGVAALIRKPKLLIVFLLGWTANLTALRLNTCMNCDYYGKDCPLGWGRLTAKLFERTREPDKETFRKRFPINLAYLTFLYSLPMSEMRKKRKQLAVYFSALAAGNLSVLAGCRRCTMKEVCPLGERIKTLPLGGIDPG